MNIKPDNENLQSISDDQELAKVLAGVNQTSDDSGASGDGGSDAGSTTMGLPDPNSTADVVEPDENSLPELPEPAVPVPDEPMPDAAPDPGPAPVAPGPPSDLETIKQEALGELRPLVDKLNVSAEEKFDTYLLLLRSTDDRDLIAPAHEAAKAITDEARKAQALLDIIKEIDFLSQGQQSQQ